MRTLLAGLFLFSSLAINPVQASHDHGKSGYKHRPSSYYPACTIAYCPPAWPYNNSYKPYYRQKRRFSYGLGWGNGGVYMSGYTIRRVYPTNWSLGGSGYGAGPGYVPYGGWSGTTSLPFGGVMFY